MSENALVLILEDDTAVRLTIQELLSIYGFECNAVFNGVEGLKELEARLPDLIICDVNMPVMGGNEFTAKVKADIKYAHIPVIMLTANTTEEDMLKGLSSGAVDYIKKPFNNSELILKINNILSVKRASRSNSWHALLSDTFATAPNLDKQFVSDLYALITQHLEISGYSVQNLAEDMNLSERNLYRKVKDHTGMPVATFIREVKLQRAHQLLNEKAVKTHSEAAYRVGFKSVSHFKKLYQKKFNAL